MNILKPQSPVDVLALIVLLVITVCVLRPVIWFVGNVLFWYWFDKRTAVWRTAVAVKPGDTVIRNTLSGWTRWQVKAVDGTDLRLEHFSLNGKHTGSYPIGQCYPFDQATYDRLRGA